VVDHLQPTHYYSPSLIGAIADQKVKNLIFEIFKNIDLGIP
jgi:hypothetical protein